MISVISKYEANDVDTRIAKLNSGFTIGSGKLNGLMRLVELFRKIVLTII